MRERERERERERMKLSINNIILPSGYLCHIRHVLYSMQMPVTDIPQLQKDLVSPWQTLRHVH